MVQERELVGEMSVMAVINFYFHMKLNNVTPFEKRLCLNHIKLLSCGSPNFRTGQSCSHFRVQALIYWS